MNGTGVLDRINEPNDIKKVNKNEYGKLAKEIRGFLVRSVSKTGGHLAANLGAVELTMALHLAMDFPKDKLVFDVGHQAYTHKILTGRKKDFSTLRTYEGLSGFPKRRESDCDAFDTGHSSTSISAAVGLATARDLAGEDYKVAAVIGDGALSGGMAYEALNHIGGSHSKMLIVLNDNKMSISENIGGMAAYLGKVRTNTKYVEFKDDLEQTLRKTKFGTKLVYGLKRSKDSIKHFIVPGMFFEDMGITYVGPIDGHNIELMTRAFQTAFKANKPVLVHVVTEKGRGYEFAKADPSAFHGIEPFDVKTGKVLKKSAGKSYTAVFSEAICELAKENPKVAAITAAMPQGTGLEAFSKQYPERFFDVGIAEEHAVTFAAGLAAGGFSPVVAVYSTFLQRAYDQIVHDVCVGGLPVVFAVDRAGIVGNDGETHQGILDISYLSHIPGMTVMAPRDAVELKEMLRFAVELKQPVALRYPRGQACELSEESRTPLVLGKAEVLYRENEIALLAVGSMVETAVKVRELLGAGSYRATVVNMRFVAPMDKDLLDEVAANHRVVVTLEENVLSGGFGEKVAAYYAERGWRVRLKNIALPNHYIEHGDAEMLRKKYGLSAESIAEDVRAFYRGN
ncbi:MAG: 1-deoxy-D-xylulose-5-phosphate synthase [Lachnospiraceae bacterium]|nr:1-deoxy-D-xylulose-5-phosphate synthase [Lachnospiraceae bacterium]